MLFKSLSGRFAFLTICLVLLAEVMIAGLLISDHRMELLQTRLDNAQTASLAVRSVGSDGIDVELEGALLRSAQVLSVAKSNDNLRELFLADPLSGPIEKTYDLRTSTAWSKLVNAVDTLFNGRGRIIRIIGNASTDKMNTIEATVDETGIQKQIISYTLRVVGISALLAVLTAVLLYWSVRTTLLRPIYHVVGNIVQFRENPHDARNVISVDSTSKELREAEIALADMQRHIRKSLLQNERLASLGMAVSKISHDLRNILSTAQLLGDHLENSTDPQVVKSAPRLINSLDRAIALCESTLKFGKADETEPVFCEANLHSLVSDVFENQQVEHGDAVSFINNVSPEAMIVVDTEKLHRVLTNLVRNAAQAIKGADLTGSIVISMVGHDKLINILVEDTGPGLPANARDNLFKAFTGSTRRGGTGLGVLIASELVRLHGGELKLLRSNENGTSFIISIPRAEKVHTPLAKLEA